MKRIRLSFFWKTFAVAMVMMLIITLVAYMMLYFLLPWFYKNYKTNQYDVLAEQLIEQLENIDTVTDEKNLLTDFVQKTSTKVTVLDGDHNVFFTLSLYQGVNLSEEPDESEGQSFEVTQVAEEDGSIDLEYSYTSNGQLRNMKIIVTLQPLNEAKDVIINIYPIAGFLCILFSFILASLFSHSIVKPIRQIRNITSEMTRLEPNAEILVTANNEIGELSQDINNLYQELRGTILALEKEVKIYSDSENKKIDFLRSVSHELKTPLASANALIEGIICDVPPYEQNPKKYLSECKVFLDKAIQLTKESLSLSPDYNENVEDCNLKNLVAEVLSSYRVIIKSKQIRYSEDIPPNIHIETKVKMFSNALSNVFSNAANYTSTHGKIDVRYFEKNKKLVIENTCTPLSENELEKISSPFFSGEKHSDISNGLGLYIVKQLLYSLHFKYSFIPMENGKGMKFTVYLQDCN